MNPSWTVVASAVAGLVLGAAAGWTARPAPTAPPPPPPVAPAVAVTLDEAVPEACPDRAAAFDAVRERLTGELASLDLQRRIIGHRRVQREGEESRWPDDPDPLLVPEAFEAALDDALAEVGGELVALECDEYPCISAVLLPKPDDVGGVGGGALDALWDAMNARGYEDHEAPIMITSNRDGRYFATFAIAGPGEALPPKRTGYRTKRLQDEASAALEDR